MGNLKIPTFILLFLLFSGLLSLVGCSELEEEIQTTTISDDRPYLTSAEAIALAKKEALDHPDWATSSKLADLYVKGDGWNSDYSGNGKWTIDLRLVSQDGAYITIYRWSVFESSLSAVYVGKYRESKPDVASLLSEEQVIKMVQDNGLQMCSPDGIVKPIGEWTAVLDQDSNGVWLVTGNVEITESEFTFQAMTQWRYNGYTITLQTFLK